MLNAELLLLDQDPNVDPREELRIRLNLELGGHMALDIPVSEKNRAYWRSVWDAQREAPVYKPVPVDEPTWTDRGLEGTFQLDAETTAYIDRGRLHGVSIMADGEGAGSISVVEE